MNIGKAISIALIKNDKNKMWLAKELGMSRQAIYQLCNRESAQIGLIDDVAKKLGIPLVELIALALGE